MRLLSAAIALVAAGVGIAVGAAVVPSRSADARPAAVHRVELRALYGPAGALADLRRIDTWRFRDRERRRETALLTGASTETIRVNGRITMWNGGARPVVVRDRGGAAADVDRRAARLRAALELGWMARVRELEVGGRRTLVLRSQRSAPAERGWSVAVDPGSFTPIAGERRVAGRVVERRRLLVDEHIDPSLLRTRSVPLDDTDLGRRRITMTNRTRVTRALAALAVTGALSGGGAATANAAPARAPIHHWVIEHKTMAGKVGRTEGWERAGARHVLDDDPGGPGFPWCGFGPEPQDWRIRGGDVFVCGRKLGRARAVTGLPPGQMMNPAELGQVKRDFIDRKAYEAAGEEVLAGRRVTVWREADRPGFQPEEERKGTLTTVYLDAVDGRFVAERHDSVASGKTQELRVLVDEVLPATRARLVRAGLARR